MKFACPHCGQHIEADNEWVAQETNCPTCSGKLIVPNLPSASSSTSSPPISPVQSREAIDTTIVKKNALFQWFKEQKWSVAGVVTLVFGMIITWWFLQFYSTLAKLFLSLMACVCAFIVPPVLFLPQRDSAEDRENFTTVLPILCTVLTLGVLLTAAWNPHFLISSGGRIGLSIGGLLIAVVVLVCAACSADWLFDNLSGLFGPKWWALLAADQGHLRLLTMLLKSGVKPNVEKKDGRTALMLAVASGHLHIVTTLLKAGADPNTENCKCGWWEARTTLEIAADKGQVEIVKTLVEGGADVNARHGGEWKEHDIRMAPLMRAVIDLNVAGVKALLEMGADPKIPVSIDKVTRGRPSVVDLVRECRPCETVRDSSDPFGMKAYELWQFKDSIARRYGLHRSEPPPSPVLSAFFPEIEASVQRRRAVMDAMCMSRSSSDVLIPVCDENQGDRFFQIQYWVSCSVQRGSLGTQYA